VALLAIENLFVEYPELGRVNCAVRDASLEIEPGEIIGLVGESGSGKSTLALAILGITRGVGRISSGSVVFDGQELLGLSDDEWRRVRGSKIGIVTQNPRGALNPIERIGPQIQNYYRHHRGVTEKEARAKALEQLELVGINDPERRLEAFPHELSGGMAQRVLIALALSCSPQLLIADEPTSGLDVTIQAQVLDDIRRSVEAVGSGLLVITQDLGIVASYCDRVYLMHAGEIAEVAPVHSFFKHSAFPGTIALLAAQGQRFDHERVRLSGLPVDTRALPDGCSLHRRCPFASDEAGCYTVVPALEAVADDHLVRCHRAGEIEGLALAASSQSQSGAASG